MERAKVPTYGLDSNNRFSAHARKFQSMPVGLTKTWPQHLTEPISGIHALKTKICCLFVSAILLSPAVLADPVEARLMDDLPSVGRGLQENGQILRLYDKGHCVYVGVLKEMPNVIVQHKVCLEDDGSSVMTKIDMVATLNSKPAPAGTTVTIHPRITAEKAM